MEAQIYQLLKDKDTLGLMTLIDSNPGVLSFVDSGGASILALSFYFRNKDLSDFILSKRAPANIWEAAIVGSLPLVKSFLEADKTLLNAHSRDGFTPLGFAAFFSRADIAKYLIGMKADPNIASNNALKVAPLHSAIAADNIEISKLLLKSGANPNAKQQMGFTPLHGAAQHNNIEIIDALLTAGADQSMKTDDGKMPLDFATDFPVRKLLS